MERDSFIRNIEIFAVSRLYCIIIVDICID